MDLTSRDGDWFLDELCSMSANVNQFLETLNRYTQVSEIKVIITLMLVLKNNCYASIELTIKLRLIK